jgi:hypothetical protein
MSTLDNRQHVATLWRLTWSGTSLNCEVYRMEDGFHLTVEAPAAVIVSERFELKPRALARAHALRDALKRRGWVDQAAASVDPGRPTV